MPSYTYNGVTVTATGRQTSSRSDKKYMRTVTVDGKDYLVHYGDPNLEMKRDDPERRRNFLARHNCSSKRDPRSPGFWACLDWQRTSEKEIGGTDEEDMTTTNTIALDTRTHDAVVEKSSDMPIPWGVTTFADLDRLEVAQEMEEEIQELGYKFQCLAGNIVNDSAITDKAGALSALVAEYKTRLDGMSSGESMEMEKAQTEQPANAFSLWKDKSGAWRWFAIYSNKYRDQDFPPEIISDKSQRTFVGMVEKGIVPFPELWHWHIPGTRWGIADWLDYADGFALASGTVDPGHEKEAQSLAQSPIPLGVSHGMPFIWRNAKDPSVIDFHITKEISPLPSPAAANPLTGFELFTGGNSMALSQEKRDYLKSVAGLPEEAIARIESGLASKAKEAQDAGLEFKEADVVESVVAEVVGNKLAPAPAVDPPLTRAEVAAAIADVMEGFTAQIRALTEGMTALTATVKELKQADTAKIAETASVTPPASLAAMIAAQFRAVGADETRIDGRSALAKSKPQEAQPLTQAGPTPFSLINEFVAMSRNGQSQ